MMRPTNLSALVGVGLLAAVACGGEPHSLSTVEHEALPGRLVSIETGQKAARLVFLTEDEKRLEIPLADVIRLNLNRARSSGGGPTLVLAGGDQLNGAILGYETSENLRIMVKIHSEMLGAATVPLARLRGVVFPAAASREEMLARVRRTRRRKAVLFEASGGTVEGDLLDLTDAEIQIEAMGAGKFTYGFDKLYGIAFAVEGETPAASGELQAVLHGRDGARITGRIDRFDGKLFTLSTAGGTFKVPAEAVTAMTITGGRVVEMSSLTPSGEAIQKPLIGGTPAVWRWRVDRNAFAEPLSIGRDEERREFARGLGMHAYCELPFALEGQYRLFQAWIGVDGSVTGDAAVTFKVLADGRVKSETVCRAGEAPKRISVSLTRGDKKAETLTLTVDFGPDKDDRGDLANWCEARLVK